MLHLQLRLQGPRNDLIGIPPRFAVLREGFLFSGQYRILGDRRSYGILSARIPVDAGAAKLLV